MKPLDVQCPTCRCPPGIPCRVVDGQTGRHRKSRQEWPLPPGSSVHSGRREATRIVVETPPPAADGPECTNERQALSCDLPAAPAPQRVVLFCPACGVQHVDERERLCELTHHCDACEHEWRPWPFPTVGVLRPVSDDTGGYLNAIEAGRVTRGLSIKVVGYQWERGDAVCRPCHDAGRVPDGPGAGYRSTLFWQPGGGLDCCYCAARIAGAA